MLVYEVLLSEVEKFRVAKKASDKMEVCNNTTHNAHSNKYAFFISRGCCILSIPFVWQKDLHETRRKYVLKKQMEELRKEMGDEDNEIDEIQELEQKLVELPLSEEARKVHRQPPTF